MNRLERISAILVRLQSRSTVTAGQIAEQFGISLRTVYRDIRVLEEAGIPVAGNAGIGYSLVDGFKLPPLMFTPEEAIAFLMAEKLVRSQSDGDCYELYRTGMDKIRAVLKTAEKNILEDFDRYIQLVEHDGRPYPVPARILQSLLRAVIQKQQVSITYFANYNQEISTRTIEPLGIFYMTANWYLLGWCRLREDYRTFRLGGIRELIPGELGFGKQHPDLKSLLSGLKSNDVAYQVIIRVKKSAMCHIGTNKYMYGLYSEEEQDEQVIQRYATFSLEHFGRWFLSFADGATILEPLELKGILKQMIIGIQANLDE